MSQQKVDQYKKEKYGRKKQLEREKKERLFYSVTGCILGIGLVVWIGFSVYSRVESNRPVSYTEVNIDAVSDYLSTLD